MKEEKNFDKPNFMEKIATFIVDKRNLFFLLFIFAAIFSVVSQGWVEVENDLTTYLPESTETRQGISIMNEEFVTLGTAEIMVNNISFAQAQKLCEKIEKIDGVAGVEFENNDEHFKGTAALFSVTFKGEADDKVSEDAFKEIKQLLKDYDIYVSSEVGNSDADSLNKDMQTILLIAVVIIILVLLFTSKSYAEVPILLVTFGAAALLNKGTNFMLGKISFISNSVAVVLQLALAIDYAIILCHRYTEEREHSEQREAVIAALSKAIPEILSSCLTTVSGLAALITMQFKIGPDLAFVLIKAIMMSILSVFILMPGLIMIFGKYMERTVHKNFVPKITFIGKADVKTKKIVPPIFLAVMIVCFFLSSNCPYCFGQSDLPTMRKNDDQIAEERIRETFKQTTLAALVVPAGSYEKEAELLSELSQYEQVDSAVGLANTEALNGYMLTDSLNPRSFSELTDVDLELVKVLYAAYAADSEDYGKIIGDLESYSVPMIDMLMFLHDEIDKGYISLEGDIADEIDDIYIKISDAKKQLQSDKYSRMLVNLNLPEEGKETFAFLDEIHRVMAKYYKEDAYIVGNSTSDYDLSVSFSRDNIIISVLSALFVIIVLLFTFKSAGLPLLLIAVIQGSIWINFSFPYITNSRLFFLGYLIISSIQMGANIDYAIVISSRFDDLKTKMKPEEAMIETLNQAFPTIVTSGTILAAAGILIACISTNGIIAAMGTCIGRGTIISMVLVLCVLPQIMLLGNKIIERTRFTIKKRDIVRNQAGTMFLNGRVRGNISGMIDADIKGVLHGNIKAAVNSNSISEKEEDESSEDLTQDDKKLKINSETEKEDGEND